VDLLHPWSGPPRASRWRSRPRSSSALATSCRASRCVDVDPVECGRQADVIIANARQDTPDKRIVSISISRHDGIDVLFDDGTGWSMIP